MTESVTTYRKRLIEAHTRNADTSMIMADFRRDHEKDTVNMVRDEAMEIADENKREAVDKELVEGNFVGTPKYGILKITGRDFSGRFLLYGEDWKGKKFTFDLERLIAGIRQHRYKIFYPGCYVKRALQSDDETDGGVYAACRECYNNGGETKQFYISEFWEEMNGDAGECFCCKRPVTSFEA